MKKIALIAISIISILFVLTLLLVINKNEIITMINKKSILQEEAELFSYVIYDNKDENKAEILIKINSENGLEYVECPNGNIIQTNNKTQFAMDYQVEQEQNYTFKIKEIDKEIEEKTVYVDDEYIKNTSVGFEILKNQQGYKIFEISNKRQDDGYTKLYYKVGQNGTWLEKEGKIQLLDHNVMANSLSNGDGTATVYVKVKNTILSHEIIAKTTFEIDTSNANNTYESESLLKAIEDYNYGSGLATVTISDQTYNLRVYEFNESTDIDISTSFGMASDVATASAYAKNTVVLKVNGDLTIKEGSTLTSVASAGGYGGTKGLIIYCTGTLTNNGNISMTARGAKAVGQNVYLWENLDGSYEYVPATGGAGGARITNSSNGNSGKNGTGRQTGGGGTGAGLNWDNGSIIVGAGASGTSYSGGSGSGSVLSLGNSKETSNDAGINGGAGSKAGYCGYETWAGGTYYSPDTSGGAGNPAGAKNVGYSLAGNNGTGGLLVIYANDIINNKTISSNGSNGGNSHYGGGSSGGGSINLFYKENYNNTGNITVNGGASMGVGYKGLRYYKGGAGGKGTVSIGNISTGTYVSN